MFSGQQDCQAERAQNRLRMGSEWGSMGSMGSMGSEWAQNGLNGLRRGTQSLGAPHPTGSTDQGSEHTVRP